MPDLSTLLTILSMVVAVIVAAIIALFVIRAYVRSHASLRQTFDMVVLHILVPKESSEAGVSNTDVRLEDLREQMGKTEAFFSAVGGLRAQRGFRAWFTGRGDHLAFEIVAHRGLVKFYLAVPRAMQGYVEQQLHAQVPHAYVEEARDYNIFSPSGSIVTRTLRFRRPGYFPIRTYRGLDADPLSALTNAMSKVAETEGAAIQYVVRSARREWRSGGLRIASRMQQGKSLREATASGFWTSIGGGFKAAGLTAKPKDPATPPKEHRLSPMEEQLVKGLEEKAAKAGLDVTVRIVVASIDPTRARLHLDGISQAFAPYNIYEFGNAFTLGKATSSGRAIRAFIHRRFDERARIVLNAEEMASVWHLPLPSTETPNIQWLTARRLPPPVNLPAEGVILGESLYRGRKQLVRLKRADRQRHVYIIGGTGVGKTTIMKNMCVQDLRAGEGVCVVDPHGDFAEEMLANVPRERADDVVYFDPSDTERPIGLNMLEASTPEAQDFATQEMIAIFYKLVSDPSMIGPMFEHYMRNAMLALMSDPGNPGTLVEIPRILTDKDFQAQKLKTVTDPILRAFWEKELPQTSTQTKGEMLPYLVSKIGRFIENTMVRNIVGQGRSGFSFQEVMDEGKILLCNLSKGKIGEMNSALLGLIVVTKLQMAALARANRPEAERRDFYLYVDEFQNFITDSIATILSEARKYKLDLTMAHQYVAQLVKQNDTRVRDAVFGNVGTIIAYRVGVDDAELIAKQLAPAVGQFDVMNIEKFNAYIRLMIDSTAQKAFTMRVLSPSPGDPQVAGAIRQLSRLKYGRDRVLVEQEILERSRLS